MAQHFDVLVVGSGIAGLSFALKVAGAGHQVAILTKKNQAESNTNYAQGGIACVTSESDDFELHVQDTLKAGDGLCDEEVVREIVREGPVRIRELAALGVEFSRLDDGRPSLGKEGGHSKRRILHVQDMTGKAIEEALLEAVTRHSGITMLEHHFAIELITQQKLTRAGIAVRKAKDRILGLYSLNVLNGEVITFKAPVVLLASGGAGQIYQYTTNPEIATGDGIAMAFRAGVAVQNMEFIQFHPTALFTSTSERFLISEAVRGEGGVLRGADGYEFMSRYDERADLASRDIVARAIDSEMKRTGAKHVWLDITSRPEALLKERFPTIYKTCLRHGVDITRDYIPVIPAAHYLCGGVRTSVSAETDLPGLYACGEVASTGLHGANRLASNSLLEAVVMAHKGAGRVLDYLSNHEVDRVVPPDWVDGDLQDSDERIVLSHNWDELKRTLWDYVAIVRTSKRLERARTRILNLAHEIHEYYWNFKVEPQLLELRNMIQVAELVVECALQRRESRGLQYTLDYPEKRTVVANTNFRRREL